MSLQAYLMAGTGVEPGPVGGAPYYPARSPLGVPVIAGRATQPMDRPVPPTRALETALAAPVPNLFVPATPPAQVYEVGVGDWKAYWSPERPHPASVLWLKEAMTRGPGPDYRPELGDNWWWGMRLKNPQYARMDPPEFLTALTEFEPLP